MLQRGTFVDYRMADGEYRPALVVRVWTPTCASLQVFPDRLSDGLDPLGAEWFRSLCSFGDEIGQWKPIAWTFTVGATAGGSPIAASPWQPWGGVGPNGFAPSGVVPSGPSVFYTQPTDGYPK